MSSILIALALSQTPCPGPLCPVMPRAVEWRSRSDDPGRAYLFSGGRQVGGYDGERDQWRDFNPASREWGQPRPLFEGRGARLDPTTANFGVMRDRLFPDAERHSLNGSDVSATEAHAAIGRLDDDSDKLRLTIIGPDAERRGVLDDLDRDEQLASVRDRLLVQSYAPEHWAVADAGFVRTGKPTIYLQSPDGVVLHRQDEYRGPEKLAEAIRRADPRYRPENDPDLNRLPFLPLFHFPRMPGWGWIVAGIALLILISHRRKSP